MHPLHPSLRAFILCALSTTASAAVPAFTVDTPSLPAMAFGPSLVGHTGLVRIDGADLEFAITRVSDLPTTSGPVDRDTFRATAWMGSLSDAGIGEDHLPGAGDVMTVVLPSQLSQISPVEARRPSTHDTCVSVGVPWHETEIAPCQPVQSGLWLPQIVRTSFHIA